MATPHLKKTSVACYLRKRVANKYGTDLQIKVEWDDFLFTTSLLRGLLEWHNTRRELAIARELDELVITRPLPFDRCLIR